MLDGHVGRVYNGTFKVLEEYTLINYPLYIVLPGLRLSIVYCITRTEGNSNVTRKTDPGNKNYKSRASRYMS